MPKPEEQKGKPVPKPAGTPPSISGGSRPPKVGETLHASDGAWSGGPTGYGKQWLQDNDDIEGATAPDYIVHPDDVGHYLRVEGTASNKAGTSEPVTSESVGPVQALRPPDPGPEPPPVGDYPASIITPVQGTPVPHVWDLQQPGATGARTASNGHWQGGIDDYLRSLGAYMGNYGAVVFDAGDGVVEVKAYDFTGAPNLNFNGLDGGRMILTDCKYAGGCEPSWPRDINNNLHGARLKVEHHFCTWDVSASYQSGGDTEFHDCLMTGQLQGFCDVGSDGAITTTVYYRCYIPGGGVQPPYAAHVELARVPGILVTDGPGKSFKLYDCMVDCSACGQADAANYGGGWTGVWSVGDLDCEFVRCVMIGAPAVNASPTVPNSVGCVVAFGDRPTRPGPRLADCVLEPGCYGYTYNHSGGSATRCVDGGGNRSLDNKALTADDLRRVRKPHGIVWAPIRPDLFL